MAFRVGRHGSTEPRFPVLPLGRAAKPEEQGPVAPTKGEQEWRSRKCRKSRSEGQRYPWLERCLSLRTFGGNTRIRLTPCAFQISFADGTTCCLFSSTSKPAVLFFIPGRNFCCALSGILDARKR